VITVERTVTTHSNLERVASYLSDFTTTAERDPNTTACRHLDDGPVRVGARFKNTQKVGLGRTSFEYEVTGYQPNSFIELVSDSPLMRSVDRMQFAKAAAGQTSVTYRATIGFKGPGSMADPLLKLAMNHVADKAAASLQEHLDAL
jgi:hypothetical protein